MDKCKRSGRPCVCGQPATTDVVVHWADGPRTYRYCEECAEDIAETIDGTELLP
jgi:hypothetical protein